MSFDSTHSRSSHGWPYFTWLALLVFATTTMVTAAAQAAPPELKFLFPAGGQVGETVLVNAAGTFTHWPPQVWINRDGITVEVTDEKHKLNVTVDAEAAPGVYWLRLHDSEGATELRPFIVGTLAETAEAEPNDDHTQPQQLDSSTTTVNGQLIKRGDVDTFAVRLTAGQTLVASMQANHRLQSPMDAILQVTDQHGFVLKQNDDARGLDPLLVFKAPRDETYRIRTFAFPATPNSTIDFAGAEDYVYRLTITTAALVDHSMPLAVSSDKATKLRAVGWNLSPSTTTEVEAPDGDHTEVAFAGVAGTWQLPTTHFANVEERPGDSPQQLELPCVVSGTIAAANEVDTYSFHCTKGEKRSFTLESDALGLPLDAVLQIVDADGKQLTEIDDSSKQRDPQMTFTAPADGEFRLRVFDLHDRGGVRFAYRITAQTPQPDFQLSVEKATFSITPGEELKVPITIERIAGFDDEIEFTITAPPGVTAAAAKSLPKGDTAKTLELLLTANDDASSGPIEIHGRAAASPEHRRQATVAADVDMVRKHLLWISVISGSK